MPELTEMTKVQLQKKATSLGLKFVPQNSKDQLIKMIEAKEEQKTTEVSEKKTVELDEKSDIKFAPTVPPNAPVVVEKKVKVDNPEETVQENGMIVAEWRKPNIAPFRIHYTGMKKPLEVTTVKMTGLDGKIYRRHFYRVAANKDTLTMFKGFPIKILTRKEFDQNIQFALYTADQKKAENEQIHINEMREEGLNPGA